MKEKGFTLIELLGVIVILSLIMLIAVPNIASTLERSKREQYLVDARKFVSLVEYELRKGSIDKPGGGNLLIITLNYLNTNDLDKDPEGNLYDKDNSYVVVARQNNYLEYYVNLVAKDANSKYRGISLVNSNKLEKDNDDPSDNSRYNLISKDVSLLTNAQIKNVVNIGNDAIIDKKE